jgi:hypothetical protein
MPLLAFLNEVPPAQPVTIDDIAQRLEIPEKLAIARVKKLYERRPDLIGRVAGVLPPARAVVSTVEQELGQVTATNVFDFNLRCREIITAVTLAGNRNYLARLLSRLGLATADGRLAGAVEDLVIGLLDEETGFRDYLATVSNGLVSLAGGVNEHILRMGLTSVGLINGQDFEKTGTKSEGDIRVYGEQRRRQMFVEVKSYKARERLLRGLQDIDYPDKIGVGFFTDAREFNPSRTETLLAAQPLAIYMPDTTLNEVSPQARERVTRQDNYLYRPLSTFFHDMAEYNRTGRLPAYNQQLRN